MLVSRRELALVAAFTFAVHLFLFAVLRVPANVEGDAVLSPPVTRYMAAGEGAADAEKSDVRTIQSPVIFALPSTMGFSRELLGRKAHTRVILSRPAQKEEFLEIDPLATVSDRIPRSKHMVSAGEGLGPRPPGAALHLLDKRPAARRVFMVPVLKERLIGGVILSAALNQESPKPWEAHASVSVSEAGAVEHVFLDQPLEPASLNQEVLQLLYSLRFKPGAAVEGSMEIYSPESVRGREVERW